ncbi:MAG: porin family protein [Tannerella sp.]|jgi:hypothetical protein|nr:porin family protein [Tannerella sp.]
MKKLLLLFFVICAAAPAVNAQLYAGGSLSAWVKDINSEETATVTFLPEAGFAISDRWAFGTVLGYTHRYTRNDRDIKVTTQTFEFAPYARFSFYRTERVRLFVDGGFSLYSNKAGEADRTNTFSAGLKPGIALNLSEKISLIAKVGFLGFDRFNEDDRAYGFTIDGNGLSLGAYYAF